MHDMSLYYVYYVTVIVLMLLEIHMTYVNIQQQRTMYVVYMHFDHKCSSGTMQFSNEDLLPHIISAMYGH